MPKKEERNKSLRKKLLIAGLLLEIRRAQRRHDVLLQEIKDLEMEKARLEREIEELLRKPEAVDKEAREKLWLMKPDEIVIIKEKK